MPVLTLRRLVAMLGACLVILHAVGMGAMAAPVAADTPLMVICSVAADAQHPAVPDHTSAQHAPCALCGLGACAMAPPPDNALPAALAITLVAALTATVSVLPSHTFDAARPRGPPLAA